MKFAEINVKFTEKVAEYIAKGYVINTNSMSGTQGEISKVDFVKDGELVRVWLSSSTYGSIFEEIYGDTVVLNVGRWTQELRNVAQYTVWMGDLDIIEQEVFYKVDRYRDWYLTDIEEIRQMHKIRDSRRKSEYYLKGDRYYSKTCEEITSEKTQEIATRYLKRVVKYKRVSQEDIKVFRHNDRNVYSIRYHGYKYNLH